MKKPQKRTATVCPKCKGSGTEQGIGRPVACSQCGRVGFVDSEDESMLSDIDSIRVLCERRDRLLVSTLKLKNDLAAEKARFALYESDEDIQNIIKARAVRQMGRLD